MHELILCHLKDNRLNADVLPNAALKSLSRNHFDLVLELPYELVGLLTAKSVKVLV